MEIFFLIIGVIVCILITLALGGVFSTPNNNHDYNVKNRNTTKIIINQNIIKSLAIINTILLTVLIAIIIFIIIKIYPYLDTLKEYYQLLESMKQWIN